MRQYSMDELIDQLLPGGEPEASTDDPNEVVGTDRSIEVTLNEANEFISVYRSLLEGRSSDEVAEFYIYSRGKEALVISYSAEWTPFIGQTWGHNPEYDRLHFPRGINVLEAVGSALRMTSRSPKGGRTFLDNSGAFCVVKDTRVDLMNWDWPGEDLIDVVLHLASARIGNHE